jgi:hypothetical protein
MLLCGGECAIFQKEVARATFCFTRLQLRFDEVEVSRRAARPGGAARRRAGLPFTLIFSAKAVRNAVTRQKVGSSPLYFLSVAEW